MGKTVVITGTTHGIGRVTARELARAGCRVLMLVRDPEAGTRVRDQIVASDPGAAVEMIRCDLSSLASVREAAADVRKRATMIDCLINNAGMVSMHSATSADGFELVFATNHLGPFLLTELLMDRLSPRGQIVNVASRIHHKGSLDLGQVVDPTLAPYRPHAAYAQSKLANVMHALALARRLAGADIRANCLHPGVVHTNLLPAWLRLLKPLWSPGMLDAERGARTTLHLALADAASTLNGAYLDEHQQLQSVSVLASHEALQEALWLASSRWVSGGG
jgi:NAD(P)-dependent dehydrogenase (short-subunit alcohol dehydrogenase family)